MFLGSGEEETEMDVNYVFLCGVMWCRFGQQDAGKELLRATNSVDPDMKALADYVHSKGLKIAGGMDEGKLAEQCEERTIEAVPTCVVPAEALQDDLDFVDVGEFAGVDKEHQMLPHAEIERR